MDAKQILLLSAILGAASFQAASADVYFYESSNGESLITDHPISTPGMVLRKTRSVRDLYQAKSDHRVGLHHSRRQLRSLTAPVIKTTWDQNIRKLARQYDIEPSLVKAIMHAESYFNPKAVSRTGAQGLMQLMPRTAKQYGVRNAFNPDQNLKGALRYLTFLKSLFPNQPELVIAAYNAGENAVYKYQGIPPYSETQQYVKKVVALKRFYDLVQSP